MVQPRLTGVSLMLSDVPVRNIVQFSLAYMPLLAECQGWWHPAAANGMLHHMLQCMQPAASQPVSEGSSSVSTMISQLQFHKVQGHAGLRRHHQSRQADQGAGSSWGFAAHTIQLNTHCSR